MLWIPAVSLARRRDAERRLRDEIENRPELAELYGDIFDEMEDVQNRKEILASTTNDLRRLKQAGRLFYD